MLPQPTGFFRVIEDNRIDGISAVDTMKARDQDLTAVGVQRKGLLQYSRMSYDRGRGKSDGLRVEFCDFLSRGGAATPPELAPAAHRQQSRAGRSPARPRTPKDRRSSASAPPRAACR